MKVTAVLVSHNGARWLPAVLTGLEESTRLPDDIVAVDTGSGDESVAIVERAFGSVHQMSADTSYAAAVRAGLAQAGPTTGDDEWVWLLHDDSTPAPDCFATLREAAENARPDLAIVGPKLREWPSLKRLLEVGITISGTGKRETGLETGEYDQGQHDQSHEVLAVNTAGMLVRRSVLEQIGFDDLLPVFGNDIDFGWRAARAGHAAMVLPQALMFHAEAAHRGLRSSPRAQRPRRDERAASIYTLLVNGPAAMMPWRVLRLFFGGLLRALGFLLVRAPAEARDEVAGIFAVYLHPGRILAGRRARKGTGTVSHSDVRHLLAPVWLPYRHGLDFLTDVGVAIANSGRDAAARRSAANRVVETGPVEPDAEDLPDEYGLAVRLFRSPLVWAFVLSVVLALVAGRGLLSGGPLHGGALLPTPDGVGHWWQTYFASAHKLGTGSDAPAPAYLLPLAFVGTVLLGHAGLVVSLLFILSVPLTMFSARRFLRRVVSGPWAPLWGGAAYALVPVVSGAVSEGRIGTVVSALALPWVAGAVLALAPTEPVDSDRRWRAAWRTALGVALLAAFTPVAWVLTVLLVLLALVVVPAMRGRELRLQLLVVALAPLVLLLPWVVGVFPHPGSWFVEAGRATALPVQPSVLDLLLGRGSGPGSAPAWLTAGLPLAGLVALVRTDTRARVLRVWAVIAIAALLLAFVSRVAISLPGLSADFRPWPGFLIVVIQGGFVLAAAIAAGGVFGVVTTSSFTWRQPVAAVAFVAALAAPFLAAGSWVSEGIRGPIDRGAAQDVPTYMSELAAGRDTGAVLVLSGGARRGIDYRVLRTGSLVLGDDAVVAQTEPDPRVTSLVERLLSSARSGDAARLASYGVAYVYAPAPVSGSVSGGLDASNGFTGASAPAAHARAWRVEERPSLTSLATASSQIRPFLILLQLVAVVAAIVLAAPGRRVR